MNTTERIHETRPSSGRAPCTFITFPKCFHNSVTLPAEQTTYKTMKERHNIGDQKPFVFVYVRAPRRWLSCRGHLTQTEGRACAETAGEGRPSRAIPIKTTEPPRDLHATSSTRRLKRRNRASDAPRFVVARQRMHLYDNICVAHKCWQYTVSLHKSLAAPAPQ